MGSGLVEVLCTSPEVLRALSFHSVHVGEYHHLVSDWGPRRAVKHPLGRCGVSISPFLCPYLSPSLPLLLPLWA